MRRLGLWPVTVGPVGMVPSRRPFLSGDETVTAWAVETRITLVIEAQDGNEALRLAQQSVQDAMWVEQYMKP